MSFSLPEGHHSITPGAFILNAATVLEFIQKAFGGKLVERYDAPDGSVAHAEVMIGDSMLMLGEAPSENEAMPAMLSVYVADSEAVDSTYQTALDAGATTLTPPADQFYGHRSATVEDAGGNRWTITAVVEQLTEDEINQRMAALDDEESAS